MRGNAVLSMTLKAFSLWLALVAVGLKGAIPIGYMLGPVGGAPVVLCTATGAMQAPRADDDQSAPTAKSEFCAFAFAGGSAAPAPEAASLNAPGGCFVLAAPAPAQPGRANISITGPPLPARGPPLSA